MDWVHCNGCYIQPGPGKSFFLTNCGHIFCQQCRDKDPNVCALCKNPCNAIQLTSQLRPEIERYFTDPVELAKRFVQVLEFQKGHRQRLADHKAKCTLDTEAFRASIAELQRENHLLKEENSKLKALLGRGERSTPRCVGNGGRVTPNGSSIMTTPSPRKSDGRVCSIPSSPLKVDANMPPPRVPPGPARVTIRAPPTNGQMGAIQATPTGILNRILNQTPSSFPPSGQHSACMPMSQSQGPNGALSPAGHSTGGVYPRPVGQPLLTQLQGLNDLSTPTRNSVIAPLTSGSSIGVRRNYELTPLNVNTSISLHHPTSQPYIQQLRPIATPLQSPVLIHQRPGTAVSGGRGLQKT